MSDIDQSREWALAQLEESSVPLPVRHSVLSLLEPWWKLNYPEEMLAQTMSVFSKLARAEALTPEEANTVWVNLRPGFVSVRDTVRVRSAAYTGPIGQVHNGRRGVVVAIRHGDIIVRYTDGKIPDGTGVHHAPSALEKLVPA